MMAAPIRRFLRYTHAMHVRRFRLGGRRWVVVAVVLGAHSGLPFGFPARAQGQPAPAPSHTTDDVDRLRLRLEQGGGKPEAIATLAELLDKEGRVDPKRLLGILRGFVDGPSAKSADPLVLAQAAYALSLEEDQQGQTTQAEAHRGRLGLLGDAWVVGPFDAQGRGALDHVLPVETSLGNLVPRSDASYAGKERKVAWRRAPAEAFVQGALFLDALLRPDSDATAYVVAYLHSDRDRWAALRIGSPGPIKAWLGRSVVLSRDAMRPSTLDQDAAAMFLRRGDNLLLLKTVVAKGPWRLFVRITDPEGRPLGGVTTGAAVPTRLAAAAKSPSAPPVRELGRLLRERTQARGKHEVPAQAWLDEARFLALVSPSDSELRTTEEAAGQAVAAAGEREPEVALPALLLLGEVAREDDDRRAALDKALAHTLDAPGRADVLARIAGIWHRQRRDQEAIARWREAVDTDPGCVPAQLALARAEQEAGMLGAAFARLQALPAAARGLPVVETAFADLLLELGRRADAEALYQSLLQVRHTDTAVLRDLAASLRARGELKGAADLYQEASRWRPDLTSLLLDQAAMLEAQGETAQARDLLHKAMLRLPDDAGLPEELGRLEARAGQTQDAAASMRRSLELRPQNPGLRRYLEALVAAAKKQKDARSIDELALTSAADGEALAREVLFAKPATGGDGEGASAEVILDRTVVRVHGNGLSERFVQRLVHVRTDRAASDSQEEWIRYEPGRQEVEVRKARVFRRGADGGLEISEATHRDERDLSEPWYGLYYDARAEIVAFESLRAGDIVEIQYSLADVAYGNELADYFGDFELIADTLPTRRWDYTLIAPKERTFYFNPQKAASVHGDQETRGEERVYRFWAENVARVESEPAMPGMAEVAPYLHVSTYRTWADVGHWYWSLIADQMQDDGSLKAAALRATRGLDSTLDKVKAIHRLVVESTRYVGLEFGIHGYKPYKATQVFERRFGDCKDKATLLVALLRTLGIDSEVVLLRTRRGGRIDAQPASLAVFDHAIAYVPAIDMYLDGTAEFSGLAELPSEDQDTMALRVSAKGATLVRTPLLPAADNQAHRTWTVDLHSDGSAQITEDLTISGQAAHEWREHYQTGGERRERYAKVWNGRYAGSVLDEVDMNLGDRNRPVAVHALVHVPRLGEQHLPAQMDLPLSSREADFTSTYARLGHRQWPLVLGYPWRHEEEVRYRLPEGARIVSTPASRTIASRFGQFTLSVDETRQGAVGVRSALVVEKSRIEPAEYPAFRAFLRETDALLAEHLIVEVKGGRP